MIEVISQTEGQPGSYPLVADDSVLSEAVWQRIEHYTAFRFSPRQVVWIIEGHGDWCPPLAPVEITAEEIWQDGAWAPATVFASPYGGYRLTQPGTYRFTGIAGGGSGPAAVVTAAQRLADYLAAEADGPAGARSWSANVGQLSESWTRDPAHLARALQNSGAADLLRPYRRV